MIAVFLVNCLAPAGWGQALPTGRYSFDAQVDRQVAKAVEKNSPAAQFARADSQARRAHETAFAKQDAKNAQLRQERAQAQMQARLHSQPVAERDATYVSQPILREQLPTRPHVKQFLRLVAENRLEFKDLIDYADPMDPDLQANDLTTIAYAAEIIGNSVEEAAQLDASLYDLSELQTLLPQVEARLLYRLALLGFQAPSYSLNKTTAPVSLSYEQLKNSLNNPIAKIEAIGSIRIALLKIHKFYQQKKLPDPADEYQTQIIAKGVQNSWQAPQTQPRWTERRTTLVQPQMTAEQALKEARSSVNKYGNLASFQKNFLNELKSLKNQDPDEGSGEFQQLQILADYAVTYALEYNPDGLKDIVKVFDEGAKETDFKQKYSPILNAIFASIFENTRYSAMGENKTKKVLALLQEFSDPEKYSLPTRIFALETAGLLFRPFNAETLNIPQNNEHGTAFFAPVNLNKPDENLRRTFAWRTSEIYCPLASEILNSAHLAAKKAAHKVGISSRPILNSTIMETYGLDSSEMQTLANKLAYIYDGFYDIHTPFFEDPTAPADTKVRFNYPETKCHIAYSNRVNKLKRTSEEVWAFTEFTAEGLFWVYGGGELFSFLGTAFRLTRGAVAALPKAKKAYTLATRGEKIAAFNNEVRQGARFANWVYKNKKQQGYVVELLVEKEPQAVKGVAKARTTEVGPVRAAKPEVEAVRVNHTYQLEGKYSLWNPERWMGNTPNRKVVGMRVTHYQPNFNTTVAQANFGTTVDGLHSMQEIEKAWSQLRLVNDPATAMAYETQPYWSAMLNFRQAQMELSLSDGLESALKNQMDIWVPMGEAAQKGAKISSQTKWWNLRWGYPDLVDGLAHSQTPFFVAPRTVMNWTRSASGQMMHPEGIANISEVLPGFFTTGQSLKTGAVHQEIFEAFFKPLNWKNPVAKTFLPDYIPTSTFWRSVQKNPVLGAQLLPKLFWRNRFVGTSAFFGAWMGLDNVVYPAYSHWLTGQSNQDVQAEINKYGDTLSDYQAEADKQLMKDLGIDTNDNRALTTYDAVIEAQQEASDGTLLTAPIIVLRRSLNNVPVLNGWGVHFVNEADKTAYAHQAAQKDFDRARLKQSRKAAEQEKASLKEEQQAVEDFVHSTHDALDKQLAKYPLGFAALPQAKKQMDELYAKYAQDCLDAQSEQELDQINERFLEQRNEILMPVSVWDKVMQERNQVLQTAKKRYGVLFTADIDKQVRAIYDEFAEKCVQNLSIQDPQQRASANQALKLQRNNRQLAPIWRSLQNPWRATYPEKAYNEVLALYPRGFDAVPQNKQPLQALFREHSREYQAAQSDEQRQQAVDRFLKQQAQMLAPVRIWEEALSTSEWILAAQKEKYAQDPEMLTPAVEQQIKNIYMQYARDAVRTLSLSDAEQQQEQQTKLLEKRGQELGKILNRLRKQYQTKHAEQFTETVPAQSTVGYGTSWNENAAE